MVSRSDDELWRLLHADPARGWETFVDQHTPTLLALIERSGVHGRDDVLDVYVLVCERLAEADCARLRRYDPTKGALAAWLTLVTRHVVVDWIRTRAGRRRLFGAIRRLPRADQQVFELYYWKHLRVVEVAEAMSRQLGRDVTLVEVLASLERIHAALSDRHRAQLASLLARHPPVSLDEVVERTASEPVEPGADPETALQAREAATAWSDALATLPREDAAIVRMMFGHGWTRHDVQRALHLQELTADRVRGILSRLRTSLARRGFGSEAATAGLELLEG